MQNKNGPCKDCGRRQLGCHSTCEAYKAMQADNAEHRAAQQALHMDAAKIVLETGRKKRAKKWSKRR